MSALVARLFDLEWLDLEVSERSRLRTQADTIQERQIRPQFSTSLDPLVVIDQVSAPVEDQPPPVHLEWSPVVGGVAMNEINTGSIHEGTGELPHEIRDRVPPIASPVDRHDHAVTGPTLLID